MKDKIIERSRVEINLDNFTHNLKQLLSFLPKRTQFMQIVKADAYGHGAYEIAKKSLTCGAAFLGVANAEEGALLRCQNIDAPILILSPSLSNELELIYENNLTPTVSDIKFAHLLNDKGKIKVHVEIDTGMGRSGIHYDNAVAIINEIAGLANIEIEGLFSHYSSSENDAEFSALQNERFEKIINAIDVNIPYIHIANSSAVVTTSFLPANLVRIGLLSYGVCSHQELCKKINLKQVMSFKSAVCQIKKAHIGDSVGYNRTFVADRETVYAVIPVGYADGYDFLLSNKAKLLINNTLYPVIGKISMDMITVDVTDNPTVKLGDEVVLLNDNELKVEDVAAIYGGLSYELMSQIGRRARRYYYEKGVKIAQSPLSRRDFVSTDFSDKKLNLIIESAISQRIHSKEIASMLYSEFLRRFFADSDKNIHYRKNFVHSVVFKNCDKSDYYEVETKLEFSKILQREYFFVACAQKYEELEKYFRRNDVEYRWLLDDNISLSEEYFQVLSVSIDGIQLAFRQEKQDNCIEIKCSHSRLKKLVGNEVKFSIATKTYYPIKSRQLSVYITEITQGININFSFAGIDFKGIEVIPIFSGLNKYPTVTKTEIDLISLISDSEQWVFPNSGVVFVYGNK